MKSQILDLNDKFDYLIYIMLKDQKLDQLGKDEKDFGLIDEEPTDASIDELKDLVRDF